MSDVKQFRWPDADPKWTNDRAMDDVSDVLLTTAWGHDKAYVVNANEPSVAFTVYGTEHADHLIEVLQWIKADIALRADAEAKS